MIHSDSDFDYFADLRVRLRRSEALVRALSAENHRLHGQTDDMVQSRVDRIGSLYQPEVYKTPVRPDTIDIVLRPLVYSYRVTDDYISSARFPDVARRVLIEGAAQAFARKIVMETGL